ncbi:MAG: magnesium transporter MgtE N-terminal domain-containing protein [Acidimicrobiales bacterium]
MAPVAHLSRLNGADLLDENGRELGQVRDVVVRLAGDYPVVTGLLARVGDRETFVPMDRVFSLVDGEPVRLVVESSGSSPPGAASFDMAPFERRPGEVLLARDVLGHSLIHVDRKRRRAHLVRAGDIDLEAGPGGGDEVPPGTTDVLRGLGPRSAGWRVSGIEAGRSPWAIGRRRRAQAAGFLDWSDLEPFVSHVPTARLRLGRHKLAKLHPGEIADLVEAASRSEQDEIIGAVGEDRELEADVFEELDRDHQVELLGRRSDAEVASILADMAPDDAADLLNDLDQERRLPLLERLPPLQQRRVRTLLGYSPTTAGGLMSPTVVCLPETATVAEGIELVRGSTEAPETLTSVYVTGPDGSLSGAVTLLDLLRAPSARPLAEVSRSDPPRVTTGADVSKVALVMTDYNLTTLAVVDDDERMVGVVTVDDLLELLVPDSWRRRESVLED